MYQRGASGAIILVSLAGGVVALYLGYSLVGRMVSQELPEAPAGAATQQAAMDTQPAKAQSYVSFDDNFFQSGGEFYIRFGSGVDENGKTTYTYIKAEIADVKTFHKIAITGDTTRGRSTGRGGSMPAFYADSQHVYFFSGTDVTVIQGADPNSFQVLSPTYAVDTNNVYVIQTTCDAAGNCTGTVTVIPGANPETFQTFHETKVPDPDGSGTVTIDAKDDTAIYYYGVWVGPLPDPDDHSVHPDTDNPVLISP